MKHMKTLTLMFALVLALSACSPAGGDAAPAPEPPAEAYQPDNPQEDEIEEEDPPPDTETPAAQQPEPAAPAPAPQAAANATPTAQSIIDNMLSLISQEPPRSVALDIAGTEGNPPRHGLFSEQAEAFLLDLDFSGFTPVPEDFYGLDDIGFNNTQTVIDRVRDEHGNYVYTLDQNWRPRPSIRLMSSGFEYMLMLDQEDNIAHFIGNEWYSYIAEDGFEHRNTRQIFEYFYHMPPGFYDIVLSRAWEFYEHRAQW